MKEKDPFAQQILVGDVLISECSPCFTIAEAGVNHNGDMDVALKLIDIAVEAGADAVKFQTFKTEHLILEGVEKAPYQKQTTESQESQADMLRKLEVSEEQNKMLMAYAKSKNILFLTTPFDEYSIDELDALDLPAYKVASTDLSNLPFLEKLSKKGKPIFLSTGMAYLAEVEMALQAILPHNNQVVLLQCSANYPLQDHEAELAVLNTYRQHFDVLLGYSDHTVGLGASPYAVAMGAKVVEKHFTLNTEAEGPDHLASLNPQQLKEWVAEVKKVEAYLGRGIKKPGLVETRTRASLQKCLVATRAIQKGEVFTADCFIGKRTGGKGLSPIYAQELVGRAAPKDFVINDIVEF